MLRLLVISQNLGGTAISAVLSDPALDAAFSAAAPDVLVEMTQEDARNHSAMALGSPPFLLPAAKRYELVGVRALMRGVSSMNIAVAAYAAPSLSGRLSVVGSDAIGIPAAPPTRSLKGAASTLAGVLGRHTKGAAVLAVRSRVEPNGAFVGPAVTLVSLHLPVNTKDVATLGNRYRVRALARIMRAVAEFRDPFGGMLVGGDTNFRSTGAGDQLDALLRMVARVPRHSVKALRAPAFHEHDDNTDTVASTATSLSSVSARPSGRLGPERPYASVKHYHPDNDLDLDSPTLDMNRQQATSDDGGSSVDADGFSNGNDTGSRSMSPVENVVIGGRRRRGTRKRQLRVHARTQRGGQTDIGAQDAADAVKVAPLLRRLMEAPRNVDTSPFTCKFMPVKPDDAAGIGCRRSPDGPSSCIDPRRSPSRCDRILADVETSRVLAYGNALLVPSSDHNAVYGVFEVGTFGVCVQQT